MEKQHIVKRRGHREKFNSRKIYRSAYRACASSHMSRKEATEIAKKIETASRKWIKNRNAVTAHQIHKFVAKELRKHSKDASFMYDTHRDIS